MIDEEKTITLDDEEDLQEEILGQLRCMNAAILALRNTIQNSIKDAVVEALKERDAADPERAEKLLTEEAVSLLMKDSKLFDQLLWRMPMIGDYLYDNERSLYDKYSWQKQPRWSEILRDPTTQYSRSKLIKYACQFYKYTVREMLDEAKKQENVKRF